MNALKIIIGLLISIVYQIQAQSAWHTSIDYRTVIATSGLNMRSAPSLKASVVKLIGYGRIVEVEEALTKKDTIRKGQDSELIGTWLRVKYGNRKGYMFNRYLANISRHSFPTELIDKDYVLLLEGVSCQPNFQYRKNFNYTGVYKTISGNYRAKKVNVTYSSNQDPQNECYQVVTDEQEKLLFIVGSRNEPITVHEGHFSYYQNLDEQKGKVVRQVYYDMQTGFVEYCYDNISSDLSDASQSVRSIVWRGDLNTDGIDDFIIQYGAEQGKIVLHLSSTKHDGQLHKAVAEYYVG